MRNISGDDILYIKSTDAESWPFFAPSDNYSGISVTNEEYSIENRAVLVCVNERVYIKGPTDTIQCQSGFLTDKSENLTFKFTPEQARQMVGLMSFLVEQTER